MKLSLIVPVLNEQESICAFVQSVDQTFADHPDITLELIFVDDGSTDSTLPLLRSLAEQDDRISVIVFSRNFGSHAALMAGFRQCTGDAAAYLAADLQDPPGILPRMIQRLNEGFDVVWGTRETRGDSFSVRLFSAVYSSLMRRLALREMPSTGIDVCVVSRKVIDVVTRIDEKNTSIFGLILWSGFKQTFVPYQRRARVSGKSKWSSGKKIKLFVDSFVSFSSFPIRLVSYLGIGFSSLGFLYAILIVLRRVVLSVPIPGWSSLMVAVVTLAGLQLLMLGIVAEYLWRTFDESRHRPAYVIREQFGHQGRAPTAEREQSA